ncbi:alpha/beta hydrolase [Sulfurovum sp. zt1-1]|uniref:Alpha/beta hydrolase n=1 Tax=Sulfurovum zhangzhouensis TaxID=3019067 RepID=A0ABT7QYK1_9BACT|nr:alpha/beta hydrolase [Sulfurovum zhangzhouensis]MDM5271907.1 alpha/beta hydrolase [Sulfurovum zhangzhouensis]
MNKVIDGISVYMYGKSSDQPIVFIHGFPFDHTLWEEVISALETKYYCISYDIRGFGASESGTGQYTMESYVNDLDLVISALGLVNPIICGFSMGGYIALRANEKFENRFKALILANTKTDSDNDEAKLKRAAAISGIDQDGVGPFLDSFFFVAFSEEYRMKEVKKLDELKKKILHFSLIGIKGGILAMLGRTDTTQSLQTINIPTLLIAGEDDKVISPDTMRKMADKIRSSTFVQLDHCGHISMIENPYDFIRAVQNFLEQKS